MAYTDPIAGPTTLYMVYMAVYAVYGIYRPHSRPHNPVYGVYGCIWHIETPRGGPTALYLVYIAVYAVYGIYRHPELAPLPCIWCIGRIQTPRGGPTVPYMVYMLYMPYTDPQSRPHCPVYGVYGCIYTSIYKHILLGEMLTPRKSPNTTSSATEVLCCNTT